VRPNTLGAGIDARSQGPAVGRVSHADIRGLVTTLLVSVGRLPRSRSEDLLQPLNVFEGCAKPGLRLYPWPGASSMSGWGRVSLVGAQCAVFTSRAIAHMKAAISRAIATVTVWACLPLATSVR